jgi:hypothetical protein
MIELLTENEKQMIDFLRRDCCNPTHEEFCSTEHLLLPWAEAKSNYLYDLLGHNLIISKSIFYNKVNEQILVEMIEMKLDSPFIQAFNDFILNKGKEYSHLRLLIDEQFLVNNEYSGVNFTIERPNGKKLKIHSGCKPIRILQKIVKEFEIPYFEEFRLEHSRILNQKTLVGDLCLSIHPLDYMTMSDNDYDWSSCMSWIDGEYRQGTVEMMNSACVIVAYIKGRNDYSIQNYQWTNKKWR